MYAEFTDVRASLGLPMYHGPHWPARYLRNPGARPAASHTRHAKCNDALDLDSKLKGPKAQL